MITRPNYKCIYVCRIGTHIFMPTSKIAVPEGATLLLGMWTLQLEVIKKKSWKHCKSLAHCTWWDMASCLNFTRRDCSNYNFAFTRYPFKRLNYCYVYIILLMKNKNGEKKKLRNWFWKLTKCEYKLQNTWILQNLKHNITGSFSAIGDHCTWTKLQAKQHGFSR